MLEIYQLTCIIFSILFKSRIIHSLSLFKIELDCSEDTSLDEVLSLLDEIQKELMDEERNILAQYEENLKFEESSLCAAIESLGTEDSVLCPVCKRLVNPYHT